MLLKFLIMPSELSYFQITGFYFTKKHEDIVNNFFNFLPLQWKMSPFPSLTLSLLSFLSLSSSASLFFPSYLSRDHFPPFISSYPCIYSLSDSWLILFVLICIFKTVLILFLQNNCSSLMHFDPQSHYHIPFKNYLLKSGFYTNHLLSQLKFNEI